MSEERQQPSYMQQLDRWTEANIINPLAEAANMQFHPELHDQIKKSLRIKMLESFRNGQRIGPRPAGFSRANRAEFAAQPQKGGQKTHVR